MQSPVQLDQIQVLGVVGAGQMGNGIAQVAAGTGYKVIVVDVNQESLEKGKKAIETSCDRLIKKSLFNEEQKKSLLSNITWQTDLKAMENVDVAIEAASENLDLKLKIGIRGLQTTDATFNTIKLLSEKLGKVFVESTKDMPGFIVNRILMPMINEAVYTLHEGIATVEAIDEAMHLGTNQPMGPLTLADFIGLDTCLAIMNVLYDGFSDSKYRPCPLLVKYVEAGWLGKKSGRGFYNYDK
jgi:3-hydroxybutyryl-CoA dehydrogenase